ncbi:hypothetical protein EMIHUDRAFT_119932 [Emiliania huxleyi CCMP1516]|uniref:Peptidase S33 tripeptidyl aminopeptidase-like C-terminal domain-containing protein n=2 Tax=Emiliania huxleyi TaxID=2903 RepID=A0A0D3IPS6_EMIH1|nr:hypothetical protein EMIHUDRAFT_119932 [Emiliania huxleyi CCMP1516]EOD13261.1 hypothetical protein EMIHUDRAFT_119932 [Emiliania huxleyi CCMP1516]|eukprot:XP_005765690.1 hypothetical protein EMIHUDRAFT_119932 [Emiliania huxleyi CCMP1516]
MGGATDPLLAARGRAPSRWRPLGLLGAALAASSIIGYAASRADATGSERLAQAPPTWSLLNPDPSLLEWKLIKPRRELHRSAKWSGVGDEKVLVGYLRVPLDYDEGSAASQVHLRLRVTVVLTGANDDVVLYHCGGPGSTDSCAFFQDGYNGTFHSLGIQQRGVFDEGGSYSEGVNMSVPANPDGQPYFNDCPEGEHLAAPALAEGRVPTLREMTSCTCWVPGRSYYRRGGVDPKPRPDPGDAREVRTWFEFSRARNRRCYDHDYFQLSGPNGTSFNFLDYVGTQLLAKDLRLLLRAIGAETLNIDGASYGTGVGSAFAAAFPEHTGRLLLNGNAVVRPSTKDYYIGYAHATRHILFKLGSICEEMADERYSFELRSRGGSTRYELPCAFSGDDVWESLVAKANGGALAAYTNAGQRYVVTAPALCSYVVGEIQGAEAEDSAPWRTAISVLSMLSSEHASWVEVSSERVLNSTCGPNWMLHGHCTDAYKPPFTEVAVNALDYEGRYSIAGAMDLYQSLVRNYGPVEVGVANENGFDLLTWPAKPTPPVFGWRAGVRALVVNSLYDGSTPYLDARWMRASLPDATILTWQGVGHCVASADYDQEGVRACLDKMSRYMRTGELPVDGDVCRTSNAVVTRARARRRRDELLAEQGV